MDSSLGDIHATSWVSLGEVQGTESPGSPLQYSVALITCIGATSADGFLQAATCPALRDVRASQKAGA